MNTIIVYSTRYGCTEKCAEILSEKLSGEVDLCNLKTKKAPDLSPYDAVIIGGSIRMGKIQKEVREFCSKNLNTLREKKIGLFVCGMLHDQAEAELNNAFPQELLDIAVAKEFFGGEFIFKKMTHLDRLIVKKVTKKDKDVSEVSEEKINRFIHLMNDENNNPLCLRSQQ